MRKKALLFIAALILLSALFLFLSATIRPAPSALSKYLVKPNTAVQSNELTVQFLGNTNLHFSDGETHILTDGFFSRPSVRELLGEVVSPNKEMIADCLKKANITKLDALIPVHSHFDHAMDVGPVAELTGATLIGSASTINIGKGYGLPDDQMQVPPLNSPISIGKFKLTFITSKHWQYPDAELRAKLLDQGIEKPIITPTSYLDYKEGISYTILIEHGATKFAIQGSAGYKKDAIPDFDADILFVSVGGLESMDETYNRDYQTEVIDAVQPEVLVPIHWDDFTVALSDGLQTQSLLLKWLQGGDLSKAFEIIEKNNLSKNREIKILPLWEVVSMEGLKNKSL